MSFYAPFDAGFMHETRDCYCFEGHDRVMYSMLTMPIVHGFQMDGAHNCISFVGKVVELSGAVRMTKPYYRYDIRELDALLTPYLYTERYFSDRGVRVTQGYMDQVSLWENIRLFLRLNRELLRRMMRGWCDESSDI